MDFQEFKKHYDEAPVRTAGIALVSLYLLRYPLIVIAGIALRVTLLLIKPALLILGGVKIWDLVQAQHEKTEATEG